MPELYSRPLSQEAETALVDFVAAYIESLKTATVESTAEIAKQKCIDLLTKTDIDILVLMTVSGIVLSQSFRPILVLTLKGTASASSTAKLLVDIAKEGIRRDKQARTS